MYFSGNLADKDGLKNGNGNENGKPDLLADMWGKFDDKLDYVLEVLQHYWITIVTSILGAIIGLCLLCNVAGCVRIFKKLGRKSKRFPRTFCCFFVMCIDGIRFCMVYCGLKEERIPEYLQPIVNQNQAQAQDQAQSQQVNVIVHQPVSSNALEMYGYGRLNNENYVYDRNQVHDV